MTVLNASAILRCTCRVLAEHQVHFKYAVNLRALQQINSGRLGYSQVGKNLVIYAESRLLPLVEALRVCLWPFRGESPRVPYARSLGDDLPLYYRFGAYQGDTIRIGEEEREDIRTRHDLAVPDGIENPFTTIESGAASSTPTEVRSFLRRYPVTSAIVQRGKGGVFRGLDLASPTFREVIIRLGYPAGEVQRDGTDGVALVRREQRFFSELTRRGVSDIAPTWIADHNDGKWAVLVTEFLAGENLMTLRAEDRLTVAHVEAGLTLIRRLHAAGLYWGDAKLANLLVLADGAIRAMDFETAGRIDQDALTQMCTFSWPAATRDPRVFDIMHYLISVLYQHEDVVVSSAGPRRVDLAELLARLHNSTPQAWAAGQLRAVLGSR